MTNSPVASSRPGVFGEVEDRVRNLEHRIEVLEAALERTYLAVPKRDGDPDVDIEGWVYYDTSTNVLRFYNGTAWGPV